MKKIKKLVVIMALLLPLSLFSQDIFLRENGYAEKGQKNISVNDEISQRYGSLVGSSIVASHVHKDTIFFININGDVGYIVNNKWELIYPGRAMDYGMFDNSIIRIGAKIVIVGSGGISLMGIDGSRSVIYETNIYKIATLIISKMELERITILNLENLQEIFLEVKWNREYSLLEEGRITFPMYNGEKVEDYQILDLNGRIIKKGEISLLEKGLELEFLKKPFYLITKNKKYFIGES